MGDCQERINIILVASPGIWRNKCAQALGFNGFTVLELDSCKQALQHSVWESSNQKVMILTVDGPKELYREELREVVIHNPHIPVILTSSRFVEEASCLGYQLGCVYCIEKSTDFAKLIDGIRVVVANNGHSQSADVSLRTLRPEVG